jgi:hypothetical protein
VLLEKSVIQYDIIVLDRENETDWHPLRSPSTETSSVHSINNGNSRSNIYAQVSRKIDSLLGRGAQPPGSILVTLLWLLLVACVTLGIFIVVASALTFSSKCNGSSNVSTNPAMDNLPDEIGDWWQYWSIQTAYSAGAGLIE